MSQAAKRAAELTNACQPSSLFSAIDFEPGSECGYDAEAFRKFIQHVSDVAEKSTNDYFNQSEAREQLRALILPKPADPLAEAFSAAVENCVPHGSLLEALRAELAERNARIVIGDG